MSRRSFAGYTYEQRLRSGFYGELYRANTAGDHELRLLEVDAELSRRGDFSTALTTHGSELVRLEHPNVVSTRSVGRRPDGRLVVVTDTVPGQITVEDLLRAAAPDALPRNIAAGLGTQLLNGLAAAHRMGLVHGAVHPRSVVIDTQGVAKLGDFAVGRALATAIAKEAASPLRDKLAGYLAPEVKRGKLAGKASDVYAAASVVYVMLTGTLPPGTVGISAGFERMIQRALDPSLVRRYPDAIDFLENFVEALEDDLWAQATPAEIAAYIEGSGDIRPAPERQSSDVALDSATEDFLSTLSPEPAPARTPGSGGASADFTVDSLLEKLDPPTDVDAKPAGAERDPISELIALSDDRPVSEGVRVLKPPDRPSRPIRPPSDKATLLLASLGREPSEPLKPSVTQVERAALAAIDALDSELASPGIDDSDDISPAAAASRTEPEPRAQTPAPVPAPEPVTPEPVTPEPARAKSQAPAPAPVAAAPRPAAPIIDDLDPLADVSLKKGGGFGRTLWVLFWLLLAAGGAGVLYWVVVHQSELRQEAEKQKEREQAKNEAALAAFNASQPRAGQVIIDSKPDQAAVWMLLGRTPLQTNPMSTAMLHEMRVEFEGHMPEDVRVEGKQWSGSDKDRVARITVNLKPGIPDKVPAAPPKPPDTALAGLREGMGRIHVDSEPAGAQVWLLVGFTPNVKVDGYAAIDYEFKVRKDGYLPGYVTIAAKDWTSKEEGTQVSRTVELKRAGKR